MEVRDDIPTFDSSTLAVTRAQYAAPNNKGALPDENDEVDTYDFWDKLRDD